MSNTVEKFLTDDEATTYQVSATIRFGSQGFSSTLSVIEDTGNIYENDLDEIDIVESVLE